MSGSPYMVEGSLYGVQEENGGENEKETAEDAERSGLLGKILYVRNDDLLQGRSGNEILKDKVQESLLRSLKPRQHGQGDGDQRDKRQESDEGQGGCCPMAVVFGELAKYMHHYDRKS